jgi:hypothetical protein
VSASTILCLNVLAALIAAWAYWPTVFWPPFSEDELEDVEGDVGAVPPLNRPDRPTSPWTPPLPEPRFAWREKAYAGRRVVSPLFHHPRAAGRWAAEHGCYPAHLTFCEIVDGVEYRALAEDAAKALLEAHERQGVA